MLEVDNQGRPLYVKLNVTDNLQGETLLEVARKTIESGTEIRSDGFKAYNKLGEQGYKIYAENFDPKANPGHLLWLHKIVSNLKAFIAGTFHGLDKKHIQRYFDEFAYRFNRRRFHDQIFSRLLNACVRSTTITYRELISGA